MKLTLTLERAPFGVRAALVEEWEEIGGRMTMAPMIRLFASGEQAIAWGRLRAHRRGLREIYLTDNRGAGLRGQFTNYPANHRQGSPWLSGR